jgi:hypothetical protein
MLINIFPFTRFYNRYPTLLLLYPCVNYIPITHVRKKRKKIFCYFFSPFDSEFFCLQWKEKRFCPRRCHRLLIPSRSNEPERWSIDFFFSSHHHLLLLLRWQNPFIDCQFVCHRKTSSTLQVHDAHSLSSVCVWGAGVYQPGRDCCCCCWFSNVLKASDGQTPNTWVSAFVAVASTDGSKRAIPGSQSRRRQLWTLINKRERKGKKTTLFKMILNNIASRMRREGTKKK